MIGGAEANHGYGRGWKRIQRAVLYRDGYRCHWCNGPAVAADHLIERDRGGTNELSNLVAACTPCNSKRGNRYRAARDRARLLAPSRSWFG